MLFTINFQRAIHSTGKPVGFLAADFITPIKLPFTNPFIELLKTTYKKDNVSERYDDIDEFAKRVSEFV